MSNSLPVLVRPAQEQDLPLVLDSWLQFAKYDSFPRVESQVFFPTYRALIKKLLESSECIVAANPEDTNHVYAFVVFRRLNNVTVVSYAYVKDAYRNLGLEHLLMVPVLKGTVIITHRMHWLKRYFPETTLIFNPFLDLQCLS